MRRVLIPCAFLLLAGCLAWLWSENRRLTLVDAVHRQRIEELGDEVTAANDERNAEIRRLEDELRIAMTQRDSVVEKIDAARSEIEAARAARKERMRRATKPPPEGVRLAILAINDLLREDGYGGLRVLSAHKLEDRTLGEVELTEYRDDLLATSVYLAEKVLFELDRATGKLTIRCLEGNVIGAGIEREFPSDGEAIELESVDGRVWERSLPQLVRARGVYPVDVEDVRRIPSIDRATAEIWIERLNALLAGSNTEFDYRIGKLTDLKDGVFRGVILHGYSDGKRLEVSMKAKTLEVCVDDDGGTAELLLRDGVALRPGGQVEISPEGYRMLLPGVEPSAARDKMFGLVTSRG